MPKSKTRGSLKEHKKRVNQRNITLKGQSNAFQRILNEQMEELKRKYEQAQAQSGITENQEVVTQ
jgi:hypothetical protein